MNDGVTGNSEAQLLAEIDALKQRLRDQEKLLDTARPHQRQTGKPSTGVLIALFLLIAVVFTAAFFTGWLPGQKRREELLVQAKSDGETAPAVTVAEAVPGAGKLKLVLPGNIQAVTEAPVLARATGYVKKRYVDIGDRVKAGQVLAELDAVELEQQVLQAKATLDQMNAALEQANSNLAQGKSNEHLAQITSERYQVLVKRGAVSRQDADTYLAQYESQKANTEALGKAVNVAKSNIRVAQANLARLTDVQSYLQVRAPFAGVITLRNIDVGALVNEGSTLLYRVSQTDHLRTYLNVPQSEADSVHVGQKATLSVPDLPKKQFEGTVTRTANALDPTSRTLLVEVQVANAAALLMPGMYAEVDLSVSRKDPPLLIPGDTLVMRGEGAQVALVGDDKKVHFQKVKLGRDFGEKVEVLMGLDAGQQVIVNPGDRVREGTRVRPVLAVEKKKS